MRNKGWIAWLALAGCSGTTTPLGGGSGSLDAADAAETTGDDIPVSDVSDAKSGDTAGGDLALSDVSDAQDGDTSACNPKVLPCCCLGEMSVAAGCVAGEWTCPSGYTAKAGPGPMCDFVCYEPFDVEAVSEVFFETTESDVIDTGACSGSGGGACCCAGDVAAQLVCQQGVWQCPAGFGKYFGDQCNGSICGGPCSLPCPLDVGAADGGSGDGGSLDIDPSDPAALCEATGGTVTTGKCCSGASDFPNECSVGGCTCAPQYLKDILRCVCGGGSCFTPGVGCN